MKDVFYTIVVVIFFSMVIFVYQNPLKDNVSDFNKGIVIDKSSDYFTGDLMYIKMPSDSIIKIRCYDIVFDKYNVGDTIN